MLSKKEKIFIKKNGITIPINITIFILSFIIFISTSLLLSFLTSCDPTTLDIYTKINSNLSGTRTIEIAVKTKYIQKGEITLSKNESIYDKVLEILPKGKIETFEKDQYTHFKSIQEFDDINFLKHVSIDNYSESPPERFYAKIEVKDYFFYSNYYFYDYIDMNIDQSLLDAQTDNSDFARLSNLFNADKDLLKITYQVKFPVKITNSNCDIIGKNNIAIWNLNFGDTKEIFIEGKRIKYLTYILLVVLGFIGIFILFLIVVLIISRRRRIKIRKDRLRSFDSQKSSYDNYFYKDKF